MRVRTLTPIGVVACLGAAAILFAQAPSSSAVRPITEAQKKAFVEYVTAHFQSPEEMVAGLFKDHDIVFIGHHHQKQEVEFTQALLKRLYDAGVYNLSFEFALHANQDKIDKLLVADTYDEQLAHQMVYNRYEDGSQEDTDLFKAAWQLNRQLPKGARPFRVVGINEVDGTDLAPKGTPLAELNAIRNKYLNGHRRDIVNRTWADFISRDFIANKEKAAVFVGSAHSTTRFRLDRRPLTAHFTSVGNYIYNYIGEKATTVFLHAATPLQRSDLKGDAATADNAAALAQIEELMAAVPATFRRIGLAVTKGTPFGDLPVPAPGFVEGRASSFTWADICNGYIYLVPAAEYKPLTPFKKNQ
jgi:hypothetical protein